MRPLREILGSLWPEVAGRSPIEQGSESWAQAVASYPELPATYKPFFDALPDAERTPFPYTVLTPAFRGHRKQENEKLVCRIGANVWVLEKIGDRLSSTCFPLADICYVENGMILLHSWITMHGVNSNGVLTSSTLKFNSVNDHVMAPLVESMRPSLTGQGVPVAGRDSSHFDDLARRSFKFRSYAEATIRPGECVMQTILQPEIRSKLVSLSFVSLSKAVAPAHLTILTDCELIDIRDDISQRWLNGHPHGGIWTYVPLSRIVSISLGSKEKNTLVLSVWLPGKQHFDSVFEESARAELERLIVHVNGFASRVIANRSAAEPITA
jgi:hypothetical protein